MLSILRENKKIFLLLLPLLVGGFFWLRTSALKKSKTNDLFYPKILEQEVVNIHKSKNKSWCDSEYYRYKILVAQSMDRHRLAIQDLWKKRSAPPEVSQDSLIPLGPIKLTPTKSRAIASEMDSTDWNWVDTYHKLKASALPGTQSPEGLWLEADTASQYLVKRDSDRIRGNQEFLPAEKTKHIFRRNPDSVKRISQRTFEVTLNPGDFASHKKQIASIIEGEWSSHGFRLKVKWNADPNKHYVFRAGKDSGKSYVDHRTKTIVIAAFAPVKTVSHELGHVLGFADHYYDVWHDKYCYYTQEYRVNDLMSDSSRGKIQKRHWDILDQAYPLSNPPKALRVTYVYGK